MQFITTDNRIAVENFEIGYFYTIYMLNGEYFQACCTGIGSDFVMFSRDEPDLLFSLTMQSAADVSRIELYGGGSGTNDYNDLTNKPQINEVTLIGNLSLSDLGIQETISDLDTIRSGAAAGATAVQPAAMATALAAKQDTISDLDTIRSGAAAGATAVQPATMSAALAAKQDTISDLETIRSGAAAGATAVQPAAMATALAAKQDTLSAAQLAAVNSSIDAAKVAQIATNENNILYAQKTGVKNIMDLSKYKELNPSIVVGDNLVFHGITWSISNSSGLTVSGTSDSSGSYPAIYSATLPIGTYYLSGGDSTIELITSTSQRERGQGLTIEITESTTQPYTIRGYVPLNTSITGTHNIKPMLRQVGDTTFEPYAMSNAELTAAIQALQAQLANQ